MRAQVSETAVAEVVIAYLEALGADVYQEVQCASGVADIVARVGAELWIVETKTSLSLAVVIQAMQRRRSAHRVFVAAPWSRHVAGVEELCRELGLGLLTVATGNWGGPEVRERAPSRRWNSRPVKLAAKLCPEHKTSLAAGSVGGGRWTPFRSTCDQLARYVAAHPGCSLRDAIAQTKHHYSSASCARSSVAKWVSLGKVPGVRLDTSARPATLYPTEGGIHV